MNTCSPMFKKADAGASDLRTEQNSYAPPGQMTTAGRAAPCRTAFLARPVQDRAVSVAFWEIWMVSGSWHLFLSGPVLERRVRGKSRARRLFGRKNFRCSDSRSGLQMAMTINISPSTTPATIG